MNNILEIQVEIEGKYSVSVTNTGMGGENCEEPRTPSPETAETPTPATPDPACVNFDNDEGIAQSWVSTSQAGYISGGFM